MSTCFTIGGSSPMTLHILKCYTGGYIAKGTNPRSKIGPTDFTWIPRCNLDKDPQWKEGTKLAVSS